MDDRLENSTPKPFTVHYEGITEHCDSFATLDEAKAHALMVFKYFKEMRVNGDILYNVIYILPNGRAAFSYEY